MANESNVPHPDHGTLATHGSAGAGSAAHPEPAEPARDDATGAAAGRGRGGGHMGHMPATGDTRALVISGWLTGVYFIIELAIGLWTGSVSVTSDAFHTFSAVGGILIALFAARFSRRAATQYKTFGYWRAQIIGALFNGLFLVAMAALVLYMGYMRLRMPMDLSTGPMLLAAAGGLVTELISLRLMYGRSKGDLNMQGALWHILQTFVGTVIIVVSALVIRFTGFTRIDPILGMAFGLVLFWASWRIIRDSLHILLQGTPEGIDMDEVVAAVKAIGGVTDVHHVHAWSLTSGRNVFSGHVCVAAIEDAPRVQREVHEILKSRFGFYFATIQTEVECLDPTEGADDLDITRRADDASGAKRG